MVPADRYTEAEVRTRAPPLTAAKQALENTELALLHGGPRARRRPSQMGSGEGAKLLRHFRVRGRALTPSGFKVDLGKFAAAIGRRLDGPREAELEMHPTAGHLPTSSTCSARTSPA